MCLVTSRVSGIFLSFPALTLGAIVCPRARHASHRCATMSNGPGYHNRQFILATKICNLVYSLSSSTHDEIAPKIEYWIEYAITERFTTIDDLVERVSSVAWGECASPSDVSRFLKEFRDALHRSESTRSFIDKLCLYILRWFAVAAAEDLQSLKWGNASVTYGGVDGFVRAAQFVGHLIERGLFSHEIVRRHLIKPLVAHDGYNYYRTNAIYQLFATAGNTLLQGLLEPEDVQICFEILDTLGEGGGFNTTRLNVR
jgi:hypothetical protein